MPAVSHAVSAPNVCWVLREDPELAEAIEPERRVAGGRGARRPRGQGPRRRLDGAPDPLDDGIGVLVLEGVMLHRVGIDGRFGAELVGEGDVLRPVSRTSTTPPCR